MLSSTIHQPVANARVDMNYGAIKSISSRVRRGQGTVGVEVGLLDMSDTNRGSLLWFTARLQSIPQLGQGG